MNVNLLLDSVSFSYTGIVEVFDEVSFHLTPGWTGVVGPNGGGKTTLLRLITGELVPSRGRVRIEPAGARVHWCPQRALERTAAIEAFAGASDGGSCRRRGLLGLEPGTLDRWATLSPGERKRWQIGAALASEPDLLLLDEPTNHLDGEGLQRLQDALLRFPGIGVLVSHHRPLLDALTGATVRVREGRAALYEGSYSAAREAWLAEEERERGARDRLRRERKKMRRRLADERRRREAAQRSISPRSRTTSPRDHDARSMAAKGRAQKAEAAIARRVTVGRRALERLDEKLDATAGSRSLGRSVFVDWEPCPSSRLLSFNAERVEAGGTELLRDVHLAVDRDSRIRLEGPNGSGKTTLLRRMLEEAGLPAERVLYVPQEIPEEEAERLRGEAKALPHEERGRLMQIVAALGVSPERMAASRALSPGEARKLAIAWGLARRVWLLVLDEPTNHLDLPAVERLEEALEGYPGALVLVTHDEAFTARCTRLTWRLAGGRIETG